MPSTTVIKEIRKDYEIIWVNLNKEKKTIEAEYKLTTFDGVRTTEQRLRVNPVVGNEYDLYANLSPDLEALGINTEQFFVTLINLRIANQDPDFPLSGSDLAIWQQIEALLVAQMAEATEPSVTEGTPVEGEG